VASGYLGALTKEERGALEQQLWAQQNGKCFISDEPIQLGLHEVDIDHVIPLKNEGKDDPTNFALTHSSHNRSKQASDLRVARVLARLDRIRAGAVSDDRGANLGDVLASFGGATKPLRIAIAGDQIDIIPSLNGAMQPLRLPIHTDALSRMRYFFALLPIEFIHHDDRINPRAIGPNIRGLIEEFHKGRPQLHVALGWIETSSAPEVKVRVFDGQHKAAAQVLLGVREVPVRIFIDPDTDKLLTANTNAGTTLRQVAFDKSVQRRLGSSILVDRLEKYREDRGLADDNEDFSERDLVNHFRGEQNAITRYILDSVRDAVTHSPDNKLRDFVGYGGKGQDKPFSYSTIEKTFYAEFIYGAVLETPWNYRAELGANPRELEKTQLIRLMSLIAERFYVGKFDDGLGTKRIESKLQAGEDIPEPHLRAYRMAKEEVLHSWLKYVRLLIEQHFAHSGVLVAGPKLFQHPFSEQLWANIGHFLDNLGRLPLWVNKEASTTVFGGKNTYQFWETIFATGQSPAGHKVMPSGLNILEMIKS
jgi:Uncharacterized protein conserved in bacteria